MPYFGTDPNKVVMGDYHIASGYLYTHAMNECLHNHPVPRTLAILSQCRVELSFSLDRFWFCLTGLKKDVYYDVYGLEAGDYLEIFDRFRVLAQSAVAANGYRADIFMVMEEDVKQMAVLFSAAGETACSPEELAGQIDALGQQVYERDLFGGDCRYRNVTALSPPLSGFAAIREGYLLTRRLNDLSFFRMDGGVITAERVEAQRSAADYQTVMEGCVRLCRALDEGDRTECRAALEDLFLKLLRGSYSVSLLRDTLSYCKHMLQVRCTARGLMDQVDLERLCDAGRYLRIEECVQALWKTLDTVGAAIERQGRFSRAVLNAVYYIRIHCAEDLSLPDIAAYAGVSPNYLSGIFRENTGFSVRDFITMVRIEKSKALLSGGARVAEAAEAVGFYDAKYFNRVFKKHTGVSPARYRAQAGG